MITRPKPTRVTIWLSLRHHTKHAEAPPLAGVANSHTNTQQGHVRDFCTLSPSYSRLDRIIMNMKHHEGKGKSDFYLDLCIEARVARDLHRDCSGLILGGLGGGGGRGGGG